MSGSSKGMAGGRKPPGLRGVRITLCTAPDPTMEAALRALRRTGAEISHLWPPTRHLPEGMEILVCEYFPQIGDAIPWEPGEAQAALLLLLPQSGTWDDTAIAAAAPHGVLQHPFRPEAMLSAVNVALSQFRYEQRLRDRIDRLDENLRSIRFVERAKLILMTEKQIGEAAAYRNLREMAMERRISIVALAEALIQRTEAGF